MLQLQGKVLNGVVVHLYPLVIHLDMDVLVGVVVVEVVGVLFLLVLVVVGGSAASCSPRMWRHKTT